MIELVMLWSAANASSNMDTNVLVYSYYLLPTHCSTLIFLQLATTCKVNHVLQLLSVLLLKLVNKTVFFIFS